MKKNEIQQIHCSLARAVAEVGDTWKILIIKELFWHNHKFDGILRQTGMSSYSLSTRLEELKNDGIVEKKCTFPIPPPPLRIFVNGQGNGPLGRAHFPHPMGRHLVQPARLSGYWYNSSGMQFKESCHIGMQRLWRADARAHVQISGNTRSSGRSEPP